MHITIYNNVIEISLAKGETLPQQVVNHFTIFDYFVSPPKPIERFYVYSLRSDTYMFPMGAFTPLIGIIKATGVEFTYSDGRDNTKYKSGIEFVCPFEPREKQKPYIDKLVKEEREGYIVELETGGGKEQPKSEPVLTMYRGWVPIGDLSLGEKLYDRNMEMSEVTGIHEQGVKDVYLVTFSDGTYTRCGLEHLWYIVETDSVMSLEELLSKGYTQYSVPLFKNSSSPEFDVSSLEGVEVYNGLVSVVGSGGYIDGVRDLLRCEGVHCRTVTSTELIIDPTKKSKSFTRILKVGVEDSRCITVSSPTSTYITNGHTVTHNTYIASYSLAQLRERFLVVIKAGYIDKWIEDLTDYLGLASNEIFVLRGNSAFKKLNTMTVKEREDIKVYLASTSTLKNLFKKYEDGKGAPIKPKEIMSKCRCNIMLVDEAHQHFNSIYESVLRLRPRYLIALSATLITKNQRKQDFYDTLFPREAKLSLTNYVAFMDMYLHIYKASAPHKVRCTRGRSYNHIVYEEWILATPARKARYFAYLNAIIGEHYISRKSDGDKLLVLVSSIPMATELTKHLKAVRPELDINRNVDDDLYSTLLSSEVSIASTGKASTAVDIKGLFVCISTVAADSIQYNIQAPGRLRERKGVELRYVQLFNSSIKKHTRYKGDILSYLRYRYKKIVTRLDNMMLP